MRCRQCNLCSPTDKSCCARFPRGSPAHCSSDGTVSGRGLWPCSAKAKTYQTGSCCDGPTCPTSTQTLVATPPSQPTNQRCWFHMHPTNQRTAGKVVASLPYKALCLTLFTQETWRKRSRGKNSAAKGTDSKRFLFS